MTLRALLARSAPLAFAAAAFVPAAALSLAACGGDEVDPGQRSSFGAVRACPSSTKPIECSKAQLGDYEACAAERCVSGSRPASGRASARASAGALRRALMPGPACGDAACEQACGAPPGSCATCLEEATSCARSKCTAPACAVGVASKRTCADLTACCLRIQDPGKLTDCSQEHTQANNDDAVCTTAFDKYAADCQ